MDPMKNPIDPSSLSKSMTSEPPATPTRQKVIEDHSSFLENLIAEITAPPVAANERFTLEVVGPDQSTPEARQFDERDFRSHRRENFPLTHHPLRPLGRRRKTSASGNYSAPASSETTSRISTPLGAPITKPDGKVENDVEEEDAESTPLLQPSATAPAKINTSTKESPYAELIFPDDSPRKVQFEVGGTPLESLDVSSSDKKRVRTKAKYEDPTWRLKQGSQIDPPDVPTLLQGFDPGMHEVDKDDLTSHRLQHNKGFRRHKFYLNDDGRIPPFSSKGSKYDHQTHEVFVELDILTSTETDEEEKEWTETARWIKYEEDVEEGTNRWGKPHVASLSFHALLSLRRLIETGVLLLDLEEKELPGIAYRIVEQMGLDDLILMEEKGVILRNLLLKHKHIHVGSHVWKFGLRRNTASLANIHSAFDEKGRQKTFSAANIEGVFQRRNSTTAKFNEHGEHIGPFSSPIEVGSPFKESNHVALDLSKVSSSGLSQEDIRWMTANEHILRRVPAGSELALVLVGIDDSLHCHTVAFVRLAESVYMPNVTEVPIPVRFIFVLLGPSSEDLDYKEIGRSISTLMSNPQFHDIAYKASERKHLLRGIHEFLDASIVIPPGEWNWDNCLPFEDLMEKSKQIQRRKQRKSRDSADGKPPSPEQSTTEINPFLRTRKWFGGVRNDIRRRYPLYKSDITDALNSQCVATIIFLYFAAVSGAIAFGGLMEKKTYAFIGITETLIGSCIAGVIIALLGGQPVMLVGATGTTLVFDESLFKFCQNEGFDGHAFLTVRAWIGVWMVVIGFIVVAFDGSVIVKFFTRFTQEIFATLISFVFIYESFKSLVQIFQTHQLLQDYSTTASSKMEKPRPNVALLSLLLMFGTFLIAYSFKQFRTTTFFNSAVRKCFSNFSVLISIILMGLLDFIWRDTETEKLQIPDVTDGLKPSNTSRSYWFVDPIEHLPASYWIAASFIPSLLLFILVFMETSIAELIIGKKELRLRKGCGFHLDIILMCFINFIMGFLGTCWVSAATVRCVTHVVALTVFSMNDPPGQKPTIVGVKEQRVTSFVVSLLVGLSVLMATLLKFIPMAVLFGVFLFMGVSSTAGVQFLERVTLFLKHPVNHPQVPFVRRVRTWKMHLFTVIQIFWLASLWGIKETPGALVLPLIIFLLVPFRLFVLPIWFSALELAVLDADGLEIIEPKEKLEVVDEEELEDLQTIESSPQVNGKSHSDVSYKNGSINR